MYYCTLATTESTVVIITQHRTRDVDQLLPNIARFSLKIWVARTLVNARYASIRKAAGSVWPVQYCGRDGLNEALLAGWRYSR
jgi:hypothetical protein